LYFCLVELICEYEFGWFCVYYDDVYVYGSVFFFVVLLWNWYWLLIVWDDGGFVVRFFLLYMVKVEGLGLFVVWVFLFMCVVLRMCCLIDVVLW